MMMIITMMMIMMMMIIMMIMMMMKENYSEGFWSGLVWSGQQRDSEVCSGLVWSLSLSGLV